MATLRSGEAFAFLDWSLGRVPKSRSALGRLGALTAAQSEALGTQAGAVAAQLDQVRAAINDLASSATIASSDIAALRDSADALNDRLVELQERAFIIDETQLDAWGTDLAHAEHDVAQLGATVTRLATQGPQSRTVNVALWTGAAIAGAIGLGLVIRYYGKRRRG